MKSFLRSIVCAGGGLLLLVAAYCIAQVAGFRVLADMGKSAAVEELVGAVDAAVGTSPASATPRPQTWDESAKSALALWGPFVPLALTVAVVVHLARVAWRLRRDIGLLRDGVRTLGSRDPKMAMPAQMNVGTVSSSMYGTIHGRTESGTPLTPIETSMTAGTVEAVSSVARAVRANENGTTSGNTRSHTATQETPSW